MTVLRIPTPLRTYTSGKSEVNVTGVKISEALSDLTTQYPAIRPHLFNEGGELRPFVNLFVGENNIKDLQGVDTPIKDGDRVMLIPSIAGGAPRHCEEGWWLSSPVFVGAYRNPARRNNPQHGDGDCFAPSGLAMTRSIL